MEDKQNTRDNALWLLQQLHETTDPQQREILTEKCKKALTDLGLAEIPNFDQVFAEFWGK
jgi:hypothetical protein